MIPVSADRRAAIEEALSLGRNASKRISYELIIGEDDYTRRFEELEYGTEDGPALVIDATIPGRLPISLEGEPVSLTLYVNKVPVRQFSGRLSRPERDGLKTELLAATAGYWLDKVSLDEEREYAGVGVGTAARDILLLSPYTGPVHVDSATNPRLRRTEDDALQRKDTLSDALEAVLEGSEMEVYDTAENGCRVRSPVSLSQPGEIVWTFTEGVDFDEEGFSYSRTEEESYSEVVVYREDDGEIVELARVGVEGSSAPKGVIEWVESTYDPEDPQYDQTTERADARQTAYERAESHQRARYEIELEAPYIHPLLERGDAVKVLQSTTEEDYSVEREWLALITSHTGRLPQKGAVYKGRAVIVSEDRQPLRRRGVWGYTPPLTNGGP